MKKRATALVIKGDQVLVMHRIKNGHEYYVAPGGMIEEGESEEQAAIRELQEETSIEGLINEKVLEVDDSENDTYHIIFDVEYISGEPMLSPDSPEAMFGNQDNSYQPMWMSMKRVKDVTFYPQELKEFIIKDF